MSAEGQKKIVEMCKKILLERIASTNKLPWEEPLKCFNSFNWVTGNPYRGINRVILPYGEYLTSKQLVDYNRSHGTDYRYDKDTTKFYPVVYTQILEKSVVFSTLSPSIQEVLNKYGRVSLSSLSWLTYTQGSDVAILNTRFLKYSTVFDRLECKNSQGNPLPSRVTDTHEVEITYSSIAEVLSGYINKQGIELEVMDKPVCASYNLFKDKIRISDRKYFKGTDKYYATLAHECGHSTGVASRLGRKQVVTIHSLAGKSKDELVSYVQDNPEYQGITEKKEILEKLTKDLNAKRGYEECVAEFTASFLLAECGIDKYEPKDIADSTSHAAYIKSWMECLQDPSIDIIKIISDADKAFNYILSATQS